MFDIFKKLDEDQNNGELNAEEYGRNAEIQNQRRNRNQKT